MERVENFIWAEAFRPKAIQDCILPQTIKDQLNKFVADGDIPNLFLHGPSGTGKTTVALALVEELKRDFMLVNGSKDGSIDVLRTRIQDFASQVSFLPGRKVVILDEAENLSQGTQMALRGFMEEFSENCAFILTANFPSKVIDAIQSRCSAISFDFGATHKKTLLLAFLTRVFAVWDARGHEVSTQNKQTIVEVAKRYYPDFRRIWNELQSHTDSNGNVDPKVLHHSFDNEIDEFVSVVKSRDVTTMANWVFARGGCEVGTWVRNIFDNRSKLVSEKHYGDLVVCLADYQYKESFVADRAVNFLAMMATIATIAD